MVGYFQSSADADEAGCSSAVCLEKDFAFPHGASLIPYQIFGQAFDSAHPVSRRIVARNQIHGNVLADMSESTSSQRKLIVRSD